MKMAKNIGLVIAALIVVIVSFNVIVGRGVNASYIKDAAPKFLSDNGLKIVVYEGYQFSPYFGGYYGGGKVWYQVVRENDPSIVYNLFLGVWGKDNIQLYSMKPMYSTSKTIVEGAYPVKILE